MDRGARILDIGCGEGEMLDLLASAGFHAPVGLDLEHVSGSAGGRMNRPWQYTAGAAGSLPFKPECFNAVLCAHSLHHLGGLEAVRGFLLQAFEALKPGGTLYVIDHYDSWQLRWALKIILSPLAGITAWTREFRSQHREEIKYLYDYLDHWSEVYGILRESPCEFKTFKKGVFFFYFTAVKRK